MTVLLDIPKARGLEEWDAMTGHPQVGGGPMSFYILLTIALLY